MFHGRLRKDKKKTHVSFMTDLIRRISKLPNYLELACFLARTSGLKSYARYSVFDARHIFTSRMSYSWWLRDQELAPHWAMSFEEV